jgi:hypothetical protein
MGQGSPAAQDGNKGEGSLHVRLRKPTPDDLKRFNECLASDPDHVGQDADSWLAEPGEFWTFYNGDTRVWCRVERVLRVSIQHDQDCPRKAIAPLIYKGFAWILGMARQKGFTEIIFESKAPRLILFIQKLFGFEPVRNHFHLRSLG